MIQRKQSLYLLLSALIMGLLYFFPIAEFMVNSTNYYFDYLEIASVADAKKQVVSTVYPIAFLLTLIVLLSLVGILAFKNRNLQTRVTIFNIVLKIGFLILSAFYILKVGSAFDSKFYLQFSFIFPLVAIVLDFLAFKSILRDIRIIKSYDRIR